MPTDQTGTEQLMSLAEFAALKHAIAMDGQLDPAILYQGLLLDGRNRFRACRELGIPLKVTQFVGTDQEALIRVLSVNQNRRDLTKSQRAAVAATLIPYLSEETNRARIDKLREVQRNRPEGGETLADLPKSIPEDSEPV